jgi:hypothetical protein
MNRARAAMLGLLGAAAGCSTPCVPVEVRYEPGDGSWHVVTAPVSPAPLWAPVVTGAGATRRSGWAPGGGAGEPWPDPHGEDRRSVQLPESVRRDDHGAWAVELGRVEYEQPALDGSPADPLEVWAPVKHGNGRVPLYTPPAEGAVRMGRCGLNFSIAWYRRRHASDERRFADHRRSWLERQTALPVNDPGAEARR